MRSNVLNNLGNLKTDKLIFSMYRESIANKGANGFAVCFSIALKIILVHVLRFIDDGCP